MSQVGLQLQSYKITLFFESLLKKSRILCESCIKLIKVHTVILTAIISLPLCLCGISDSTWSPKTSF